MRQKYVDEAVGVYIMFGTHPGGTVDVADQSRDVFTGLPADVAAKVVDLQAEFRDGLYKLLCERRSS